MNWSFLLRDLGSGQRNHTPPMLGSLWGRELGLAKGCPSPYSLRTLELTGNTSLLWSMCQATCNDMSVLIRKGQRKAGDVLWSLASEAEGQAMEDKHRKLESELQAGGSFISNPGLVGSYNQAPHSWWFLEMEPFGCNSRGRAKGR